MWSFTARKTNRMLSVSVAQVSPVQQQLVKPTETSENDRNMPPKGCSSNMLRKDTNACVLHSAKRSIRATANQRIFAG
ncbi:hypothetical protein EYF80_030277 [Liparis tanakae]|uniref:Uncharacterized protein n=1 Tax=Liparis tanakae TaxID=230148 RepID=A0A4Z2H3K5_9TELE|nr:hypothetical protein EYF80_030277 [Liparis tanakae]